MLAGDVLDGFQLIAQGGGALEVEVLGGGVHLVGEPVGHAFGFAAEHVHQLLNHGAILLPD